ncbi:MAG TPA: ATP-dependent zinc metalloprotease FtsH, partial [Pirellulales bacterium]|nr:ATP-dependent zinc metalloprotease FtsH [Pirellulales bacterium]
MWWRIWSYLLLAVVGLWIWQDFVSFKTVHTLPYSEFKHYLALGQVVQCELEQDEIQGQIDPKRPAKTAGAEATTAAENKPAESKPAEAKPAETKPAETKPAETKPAETKPAETKPAETKPAENKPAEAKPAVAANEKTAPAGKSEPSGKSQEPADEADQKPPTTAFEFRTVRVEDPELVDQMEAAGVKFQGVRQGLLSQFLIAWLLPLGLMMLFWFFLSRRMGSVGQSVMSFGKSRARIVADTETGVTFADVAGCEEAKQELEEVVDFLKNPARYVALGAKIPKGVLLIGPPGTGKTLLARAVAGEAHVKFYSLSGSEFVEMFVGVGASRVRDLFQQAKATAPCIIFIDELDAIGRERGVHVGAVNDEREQTLNQLLVEMDGFEANVGVILLAASNRPEVLDRALLRPGRFDRQIVVDAPDLDGREAVLKIHARGKPLAEGTNLRRIAQVTPGFSGADLANTMNEAALLAARRQAAKISQRDLEDAVEKVVAGPERRTRRLGEEEKRRVAYHEVGHALVATYSAHGDRVHKISIVPRGRAALGYTFQLPTEEQFLLTQSELIGRIRALLGGRAAEETVFQEVSTGAENDLEKATALARQMVCLYGMSESVGLTHCAQQRELMLARMDGRFERDCSEHTAEEIDAEVKKLL